MIHERFSGGMQKKYKSRQNLNKSTETVQILFKRLEQILDNPKRMKYTKPTWIMDKTLLLWEVAKYV